MNNLYIGSKKIKLKLDNPDEKDSLILTYEDDTKSILTKKLYNVIVKTEKGNGDTLNVVANTYIGMKFLKELADYGYERYQIEGVAITIGNLVHNLTENKIGEKFGVKNSDRIKLKDILI